MQVPITTPAWPRLPLKEKPTPHDFPPDKVCCLVLSATKQDSIPTRAPKRRPKKRPSQSAGSRPPPSFWRPEREWGGKSAGYALGYEGSRPTPMGSTTQWKYRRDQMRSGVIADL